MLQNALDKTGHEYTIADIKELLSNQAALLWLIRTQDSIKAVFITQIHIYPSKKIGIVLLGSGDDMKEWQDIIYVFSRYFQENDCDFFDIAGRRGWLKIYEKAGFKETYTTIRKSLK